jgi:C4-dicarboxylate transporter DctM subunit
MAFASLRLPVAFSMGLASVSVLFYANQPLTSAPAALFSGINSFTFMAIPAFIFAGDLMGASGISKAIMDLSLSIFGRFRGSVGATTVVTSLLFGTLTGSSLATVSAIGGMMLPEMEKHGYDKRYSAALNASCGFLGILVPPSIPGIIYAMMSGESLLKVWLCTLTPGILIGIAYMVINFVKYGWKEKKTPEPFRIGEYFVGIARTLKSSILALLMPVIIFFGIYGGIFTPTEAGGVADFYGLIAGWVLVPLLYRRRPNQKLWTLAKGSMVSGASIACILAFAAIASRMVTFTRIPEFLTDAILSVTNSKIIFLLLVNLILLIAGMFMETNTAILLLGPILIPVAKAYGIDTIHFASIVLLNMEIGMITPPMAGNLFVGCRIAGLSIDQVLKDLFPFFFSAVGILLLITYVPQIVLFMPGLLD